ncbi:MAG TPA: GyrI-like domain-containing protein [Acidimicrobiales bacterium]|nr:GyrI-like domain-containing protein [Acidimicrobiales bacterium]
MPDHPTVVERTAQPYAAIAAVVTMQNIGEVLPPLHPKLAAWLDRAGASIVGEPFFKYNVIDMERAMEVEVGFPIARAVDGDDSVVTNVLPAGRYATAYHHGHPADLVPAVAALLQWADDEGLVWDMHPTPKGDAWGCRLEIYETNPPADMNDWKTQLAFRLADT